VSQKLPILTAEALLTELKLDPAMNDWRSLAGMDKNVFDALILKPLYRFAESVQLAPASEMHHHSGPGGLLKHTIDVITIALKKRRGIQLPLGGSISDINRQRDLWTYGVFVACLLHDIGKMSANIRLILLLKDGTEKRWTPHDQPLSSYKNITYYRIQFEKTPYAYHHHIALTHFDFLSRDARAFLVQVPAIMAQLTAYLWGDRFESGIIGEIAEAADQESTARDLQLPNEPRINNSVAVIDRYLRMMRQWISERAIKINSNGGMGWVDNNGHLYLICRSLAEKIIQEGLSLGLKNLPQDHLRVYDILQEHGYALPTPDGKAIWTIQVKTAEFTHQFTCLKFVARQLTVPTKPLLPLEGEITLLDAKKSAPEKNTQETLTQDADSHPQETEKKQGEKSTAAPLDIMQEHADNTDTDINTAAEKTRASVEKNDPEKTAYDAENAENAENPENTGTAHAAIASIATPEIDPDHSPVSLDGMDTGAKFLSWLKKGLIEKTILINDVNAEVHIVEEGVFLVAPAIFKTFLNKHNLPGETQHKNLSRRFQRLRKHLPNGNLNIHGYWAGGKNRVTKISGWILPFNIIYENDYPVPKANKFLRRTLET
jgi:hypothetical protein